MLCMTSAGKSETDGENTASRLSEARARSNAPSRKDKPLSEHDRSFWAHSTSSASIVRYLTCRSSVAVPVIMSNPSSLQRPSSLLVVNILCVSESTWFARISVRSKAMFTLSNSDNKVAMRARCADPGLTSAFTSAWGRRIR